MSDPLGTYSFLPWLRRGVAASIERVDGTPSADEHVDVPVRVTFNVALTSTVPLALMGPGEVSGLDPSVVIRVHPLAESYDAESNYFPLLEVGQPDLPWRYTPARATPGDRLRPWLSLVTLRDDEIEAFTDTGTGGALPVVTVASADALPLLSQSWAWAHVQIAGAGAQVLDAAALRTLLASSPERVIARLISPRRLDPNTRYTSFLVPAFERGRLAGLGEVATGDSLAPAWVPGAASVRLPVYYRWRFGTTAAGDFEYLARQLQARPLPPGVGRRPMAVDAPGAGLPPAADTPLELEGALVGPNFQSAPWDGPTPRGFRAALATLLNRPADLLGAPGVGRIVAPPLYGRWHALRERLVLALGAVPRWFHELNADPRWRVGAGLGTKVVQAGERQLMASAWAQVDGIREANERLRLTQLAREAAVRMYERHVAVADAESVLEMTAPVHAKVLASPMTISSRLGASPVPPGVLDPQFRCVSRPRGPVGRRLGLVRRGAAPRLVGKLNRGDLVAAAPPPRPVGIVTPGSAGALPLPPWATPEALARLRSLARALPWVALILFLAALLLLLVSGALVVAAVVLAAGAFAGVGAIRARRTLAGIAGVQALSAGSIGPADVRAIPPRPTWVPREAAAAGASPSPGTPAPVPGGPVPAAPAEPRVHGEPRSTNAFREAASRALAVARAPLVEPEPLVAVAIPALRERLLTDLHPKLTVVAGVRERLKVPGLVRQPSDDPVEPVMAAPEFPQPMYRPLADLSQDWLLPGLDKVPQNTTTVLKTNQRFVESYMVGLNHEMARELLWNEYPTDLRGSYFRQFWDVAGYVAPPNAAIDPESLRDIRKLEDWPRPSALGANSSRRPPPGGDHLVLLVRGELLRRYPNTMVYAVKAVLGAKGRDLGTEERHPVFSGRLDPDVSFFGFELTAVEARGVADRASPDQGWYFLFQEQPSEPRFGLDVAGTTLGGAPARWSDLSWGHLAATDADLTALSHIDLDAALPDTRGIADPKTTRWHADQGQGDTGSRASDLATITLQQPMRVALHASDMIPAP